MPAHGVGCLQAFWAKGISCNAKIAAAVTCMICCCNPHLMVLLKLVEGLLADRVFFVPVGLQRAVRALQHPLLRLQGRQLSLRGSMLCLDGTQRLVVVCGRGCQLRLQRAVRC